MNRETAIVWLVLILGLLLHLLIAIIVLHKVKEDALAGVVYDLARFT